MQREVGSRIATGWRATNARYWIMAAVSALAVSAALITAPFWSQPRPAAPSRALGAAQQVPFQLLW
jgi:hypothetical protein